MGKVVCEQVRELMSPRARFYRCKCRDQQGGIIICNNREAFGGVRGVRVWERSPNAPNTSQFAMMSKRSISTTVRLACRADGAGTNAQGIKLQVRKHCIVTMVSVWQFHTPMNKGAFIITLTIIEAEGHVL
jgi:hypothetical protein